MATGQGMRVRALCLTLLVGISGAAGCLGGKDADKDSDRAARRIAVWSLEFQPDRLRATRANARRRSAVRCGSRSR